MKKLILLLLYVTSSTCLFAQEFSFPLFFEDAIGNKDTIIIGYDENATDGEDLSFGELDIKGTPLNGALEVRVADYDYNLSNFDVLVDDFTFFHSKIQIVKKNCVFQGPFPPPGIIVKADFYPLTVSWDSMLFNLLCNNQTVFTDWHPGGWFDAGTNSKTLAHLADSSSVTIEKHFSVTSYLTNNNLDTIKTFFLGFIPDGTISTKDNFSENNYFEVFPNPTLNSFFIKNKNTNQENISFQLLDFQGITVIEKQSSTSPNHNIEVKTHHLPAGIYFLHIQHNNTFTIQKIVITQ